MVSLGSTVDSVGCSCVSTSIYNRNCVILHAGNFSSNLCSCSAATYNSNSWVLKKKKKKWVGYAVVASSVGQRDTIVGCHVFHPAVPWGLFCYVCYFCSGIVTCNLCVLSSTCTSRNYNSHTYVFELFAVSVFET